MICERQVLLAIKKLSKWAYENGFKFPEEGVTPVPSIEVKEDELTVSNEHKFLAIILD